MEKILSLDLWPGLPSGARLAFQQTLALGTWLLTFSKFKRLFVFLLNFHSRYILCF